MEYGRRIRDDAHAAARRISALRAHRSYRRQPGLDAIHDRSVSDAGQAPEPRRRRCVLLRLRPAIISTAGALVDAARHLGLSRVAVAAPYEPWLLAHLVDYLKAAGLSVLNAVGLGEQANVKHGPDAALALAKRAWVPDADGLVLSCGNFRSLEAIPQIEQHIGKPLLTSNGCALWSALTVSGWRGAIPSGGHLLQRLAF
ncbi:MAG: hypothetical protein J0H17_05245 [Rhizobiales bacterium]|nr:hypothetical protein [Hyphomicrobiales bacterium]